MLPSPSAVRKKLRTEVMMPTCEVGVGALTSKLTKFSAG